MRSVRCIIVEDERPAVEVLKTYIEKTDFLQLDAVFTNATTALAAIRQSPPDLIFLDVNLPGLSGLDFIKLLHPAPSIILTTAYPDYAVQSFELEVLDYLLKPFSFERFVKAVNRFLKTTMNDVNEIIVEEEIKQRPFIFIKAEKKMMKIFLDEILYFEAQRNYLVVYTIDSSLITYHALSHMEERLPKRKFLRIHRSFIVAIEQIKGFDKHAVIVRGKEIPIGKNYSEDVSARLAEYFQAR